MVTRRQRGSAAMVVILLLFVVATAAGALFWLRARARLETAQTTERRRIEQTTRAEQASPSAGAAAPARAEKVLRLAAPPGASAEDVATSVAILNRRFEKAEIPARAEVVAGGKIAVRLPDEAALLKRAGTLLAAGGHLQFLAVADLDEDASAKEIERIKKAKEQHAYDPAKERYDALPREGGDGGFALVERAGGVEGHFVASAAPRHSERYGWVVDFTMNPEGAEAFFRFTTRQKGKYEAVVLDGVVKQVFYVKEPIRESGMLFWPGRGFGREEALALTALITSGQLPIDLSLEETDEPAEGN
jgi:preprotein translocase subunit SecD